MPESLSNYESSSSPYLSEHYYYNKIFPKGDDKYFLGKSALRFFNVNGLRLSNIRFFFPENISTKWKNGAQFENITDLKLDNFSIKQAKSIGELPLLVFKNVQSGMLRNSIAEDNTNSFLEIQGEKTKDIRLLYNDLSKAKTPISFESKDLTKKVSIID